CEGRKLMSPIPSLKCCALLPVFQPCELRPVVFGVRKAIRAKFTLPDDCREECPAGGGFARVEWPDLGPLGAPREMDSLVDLRDSAGWIDCASSTRRTRIIYRQSINLALQRAQPGVYAKTAASPKLSRSEFIEQGGILVGADRHGPQVDAQLRYVTC